MAPGTRGSFRGLNHRPCRCGCGGLVTRSKSGYLGVFILGHQASFAASKRPKIDWEDRLQRNIAAAPMCRCGCGERVLPTIRTADAMEQQRVLSSKYPKYIYGHDKRPPNWNITLTKTEQQAILGTLLGDGCIGYPHSTSSSPRLSWTHGPKQRDWVAHKAGVLARLTPRITECKNAGYGETSIRLVTSCLPCLQGIFNLVRASGSKVVSVGWLDSIGDIGLAWWVCDDGSVANNCILFHTEGYSEGENTIIADWISRRYGHAAVTRTGRGHFYVRANTAASRRIRDAVRDYIPESMQYKICKGTGDLPLWAAPSI